MVLGISMSTEGLLDDHRKPTILSLALLVESEGATSFRHVRELMMTGGTSGGQINQNHIQYAIEVLVLKYFSVSN